jgi:hypothetical protein
MLLIATRENTDETQQEKNLHIRTTIGKMPRDVKWKKSETQ